MVEQSTVEPHWLTSEGGWAVVAGWSRARSRIGLGCEELFGGLLVWGWAVAAVSVAAVEHSQWEPVVAGIGVFWGVVQGFEPPVLAASGAQRGVNQLVSQVGILHCCWVRHLRAWCMPERVIRQPRAKVCHLFAVPSGRPVLAVVVRLRGVD
ncbi:MAG: hypothetical protein WA880_01695, partial [Ornithinimicrobium sp.]